MTIAEFKNKLKKTPKSVEFSDTMAVIEANYIFKPTEFINGTEHNPEGTNSGSCKLFAFAILENLTEEETLACFGKFYFEEVLKDPNGTGHQNIRNFMENGFEELKFESAPLTLKK